MGAWVQCYENQWGQRCASPKFTHAGIFVSGDGVTGTYYDLHPTTYDMSGLLWGKGQIGKSDRCRSDFQESSIMELDLTSEGDMVDWLNERYEKQDVPYRSTPFFIYTCQQFAWDAYLHGSGLGGHSNFGF